jgi:hypothetical protein
MYAVRRLHAACAFHAACIGVVYHSVRLHCAVCTVPLLRWANGELKRKRKRLPPFACRVVPPLSFAFLRLHEQRVQRRAERQRMHPQQILRTEPKRCVGRLIDSTRAAER